MNRAGWPGSYAPPPGGPPDAALMYAALYLWWFYAAGARTTSALRERARQRANLVIDNAFATHPGFSI